MGLRSRSAQLHCRDCESIMLPYRDEEDIAAYPSQQASLRQIGESKTQKVEVAVCGVRAGAAEPKRHRRAGPIH